jgi:hypothetical protein
MTERRVISAARPSAPSPRPHDAAVRAAASASFRGWSTGVARGERVRLAVGWATIILLYRQTFAAPIRAFVPILWYVPDVVMAAALGAIAVAGLRAKVIPVLVSVVALAVLVLYAALNNPGFAVALAVRGLGYMLLAFFAGLGVRRGDRLLPLALVVAAGCAILGVFYDALYTVPWADAAFEGFGGTGEAAREWSQNGARRLSGLGIASTDTSVIIAAGALTAFGLARNRVRPANLVFAAAAVAALLLTTQKATAGWLIVTAAVAYGAPLLVLRDGGFAAARWLRWLGVAGLVAGILVPPVLAGASVSGALHVDAATIDQRLNEVWPRVLPHLFELPQVLLGYGLGGVGPLAGRPELALIDNMFLFTALSVGLPTALALFLVAGRALLLAPARDPVDFAALAIVALLALNGITANIVVAGAVASIYLGYGIGCLLRPTRRARAAPSGASAAD